MCYSKGYLWHETRWGAREDFSPHISILNNFTLSKQGKGDLSSPAEDIGVSELIERQPSLAEHLPSYLEHLHNLLEVEFWLGVPE